MSDQSTNVTFLLTSIEPRAWLVLTGDLQEPRVVEMQQTTPNVWSASEDLIQDEYRCRFYCGNDTYVCYQGPAHITGGIDGGMDTLLSINFKDETETVDLGHPFSKNRPDQ